jgi:glutathione peroxidase
MDLLDVPIRALDGHPSSLAPSRDLTLLWLNAASECGPTPLYEGLERPPRTHGPTGRSALGSLGHQFMGQEPGTADETPRICSTTHGGSLPPFQTIDGHGKHRYPIDAPLAAVPDVRGDAGDITWNFEKFHVARSGAVAARVGRPVEAEDPAPAPSLEELVGR